MINVVQEIVDKLRTVYPSAQYDVYTERIEQGFSAPCFSIRQLRADVTPYPSGLHEIVQHMDVLFFPSDGRPQEQCREIAHTLLTFDRYRERRDLLGVLLDKDQRYTFSEVDALIDNFMKGKVN